MWKILLFFSVVDTTNVEAFFPLFTGETIFHHGKPLIHAVSNQHPYFV
jgi:hypothetical protein